MSRRLRWIAAALTAVLLVAVLAVVVWTRLGPDPTAEAQRVAAGAPVRGDGWFGFGPRAAAVGVVLYPGARIDGAAYAPVARDLATRTDAFVAVADMPLDIALLDLDAADAVREAVPAIPRWVVGGHSLGGVAATRYATDDASDTSGLLLWASYPAGDDDVPQIVTTTSITGARDRVLDRDAWERARPQLPDDAELITLPGVTHAQFGDYGPQSGDGTPAVSDAEARRLIVDASAGVVTRAAR